MRPISAFAAITLLVALGCASPMSPASSVPLPAVAPTPVEHASSIPLAAFSVPRLSEDIASCDSTPVDYAIVGAGPDGVTVNGDSILAIGPGGIDPAHKKGQLVTVLYDRLIDMQDRAESAVERRCVPWALDGEFPRLQPRVLFVLDPDLSFSTVRELAYTAAQAQFSRIYFLVDDDTPTAATAPAPSSWNRDREEAGDNQRPPNVSVELGARGLSVRSRKQVTPLTVPCTTPGGCTKAADHDWKALTGLLRDQKALFPELMDVVVAPNEDQTAGAVIRAIDAASADDGATLFPAVVLAGGVAGDSGAPATWTPAPASPRAALSADATVPVLTVSLPAIGADYSVEDAPPKSEIAEESVLLRILSQGGDLENALAVSSMEGGESMEGKEPEPKPTRAGVVDLQSPTVEGGLTATVIQRTVNRSMNQLRYCYQRELTKDDSLRGAVEITFVIDSAGRVTSASATSNSVGSDAVGSCISGRFHRMTFPAPSGGGPVTVTQRMTLAP